MLSADFVNCFFNILIGSLRFFCINHMNIVISKHFLLVSLNLVGIKYKNQSTFLISLIIT